MTISIILAAGQGTRLRPLTDTRPKCLVKLLGKSLLERQAAVLKYCGVDDIHVATGYRANQIDDLGFATTYNPDFETTNMVTSLFLARNFMKKGGDLLISYGDIVFQPSNLKKILSSDEEISLMVDGSWEKLWGVRLENPLEDAETFQESEDGFVTELGKVPNSIDDIQGQYTGLIKIRADMVGEVIEFYDSLDPNALYDGKTLPNMYMTSFLQALINTGKRVKSVRVDNGWLEVDSVEDLEVYERLAARGELSDLCELN